MSDSVSMANMNPPGKLIYNSRYIHISAITLLPENEIQIAKNALKHLEKEQLDKVSVLRISSESQIVSALNYPNFFEDGFPELLESWRIDSSNGKIDYRTYQDSLNPPILHRKRYY